MFAGFRRYIKKLKIGKGHLDWLAGLLTIPVLVTVIILNLNNLNSAKKNANQNSTPAPTEKVILVPQNNNQQTPIAQTTNETCKKEVGPISITSPKEGEAVTDNPVYITIKYNDPNYCSVVWSYRINGGTWSEFSSSSPSLYNLTSGNIKFDLRVQSTVSQDTDTLSRNFVYQSSSSTSPTPTPSVYP